MMGTISTIAHNRFPTQGKLLGVAVQVCFHYDTAHQIPGVIVRDDMEEPFETIIRLDTGQFVRACECQYSW